MAGINFYQSENRMPFPWVDLDRQPLCWKWGLGQRELERLTWETLWLVRFLVTAMVLNSSLQTRFLANETVCVVAALADVARRVKEKELRTGEFCVINYSSHQPIARTMASMVTLNHTNNGQLPLASINNQSLLSIIDHCNLSSSNHHNHH